LDWIEDFVTWTAGLPSPAIFRQWAAITAVGGALERRCYVMSAGRPVYPNLYVLLVATPGVGKNVIQEIHNLWFATKCFKVAPNSITKAGLIDALAEAGTTIIKGTDLTEYHSMLVASAEFGVLVPAHDLDFLSNLNYIFDNPPSYVERRRWVNQGKETVVVHPQLTLLAGTQPGFLKSLLPEEAWTMGTTSRLIMVYAADAVDVELHLEEHEKPNGYTATNVKMEVELCDRLGKLRDFSGPFKWTSEAKHLAESWYPERHKSAPDHSKLTHYIPRRFVHVLKLAIISAASRGEQIIRDMDFTRALDWLLEAEKRMPDIFREMSGRSDAQIIEELHRAMWKLYRVKHEPIHQSLIYDFLKNQAPAYAIQRILDVAERSHTLVREAGTELYRPKQRHERGVE